MIKKLLLAGGAAALSVVALAGCGADAYVDFEPEWSPTGAKPTASFDATVAPRREALDVRYTLRNQGAEPIVAYVGVEGDAASHAYDVYVTAREDGTVELAKRTFAIPPGVNAAAPISAADGRGKYPLNGPQHLFCSPPATL